MDPEQNSNFRINTPSSRSRTLADTDEETNNEQQDAQIAAARRASRQEMFKAQAKEGTLPSSKPNAGNITRNAARQNIQAKKLAQLENEEGGSGDSTKLGFSAFLFAITIAISIDVVGFFMQFLPGIGGFIVSFGITPLGAGALMTLYNVNGVPLNKNMIKNLIMCGVVEFIPVVNGLPAFTALVVLNQQIGIVQKIINLTPAGKIINAAEAIENKIENK